jgi:release factor glutamine methyltransferase
VDTIASVKKTLLLTLLDSGIEQHEARREADLIIQHVLGFSVAEQLLRSDLALELQHSARIQEIAAQRKQRFPLQYCLGETWFMGLRFEVGPEVLIPRADTEILVETALELLSARRNPVFLDLGTGSGAIAVALLCIRSDAKAYAVDVSDDAVSVAARNARAHKIEDRLSLVAQDWELYDPGEPLDAIISNPPYIPLSMQSELQPEVGVFEPKQALFGTDDDGLGFYRKLSQSAGQLLKPDGFIALEVGKGQAEAVADIFRAARWKDISMRNDLNLIPRVVSAFRADFTC